MQRRDRFFVITGGPGAGKTTLIEALAAKGYHRSVEAGRGVIQQQTAINGPALPWKDRALFAELMLSWEMRSYALAAGHTGPVLFDRGLPDIIGYLRLEGLAVPAHVHEAAQCFRYHPTVLIAPPWEAIFTQDEERKQTFEEACRTYENMRRVYADYGYDLVPLPLAPVEDRVAFVEGHLERHLFSFS
ncbi:AAA family ATPase [Rhodoligotrophos defluvii]|uniref:AAA family ATPase n=1 Tax=Rhodoligotrophos defluvii TaxID=2561934 RepID=UPI0010C93C6E|nr:AAA family ATPase [Rhodoligotrophos defluvii]